ncbi:hypothetical protein PIB30_054918 [Stylosanthes scabra]|uniref:Uncharacterized protein n=1 Tax=Stylosanthes scabra TaxID=79078 RepID=A0ABU6UKY5_9FABA|nr:hypothetical protein [Stylosanthes scabra]
MSLPRELPRKCKLFFWITSEYFKKCRQSGEEVQRTIEQLNGWIVWGCRMRLTESRYRRDGKMENKSSNETVNRVGSEEKKGERKKKTQTEMTNRKRTYMDILMEYAEENNVKRVDDGSRLQILGE